MQNWNWSLLSPWSKCSQAFSVDLIGFVALTVSVEGISEPSSRSQRELTHSRHWEQELDWLLCKSDLFQTLVSWKSLAISWKHKCFCKRRLWLTGSTSLCSRGDQILEADSVSLRHAALSEAYAILSECGPGPVSLIISRHPNPKVRRKCVSVSGLISSGAVIWVLLSGKQQMKNIEFFSPWPLLCKKSGL